MRNFPLTVIIPAYNEEVTIEGLLEMVVGSPFAKQIVIVDDGSRDATAEILSRWRAAERGRPDDEVILVRHPANRGKGAAIRTGLALARGEVVLIQDADQEYDVADYPKVIRPILEGKADVVYGSRYLDPSNPLPWTPNRVCVILLNLMVRVLYGRKISDEATCYKAFRLDLIRRMDLRCERFEFCPEVTAKACRMGARILEVPIQFRPRSHREGKKIRWWDGVEAILTLLRWRVRPFRPLPTCTPAAGDPGPAPEPDVGATALAGHRTILPTASK